jgi:hypothetical protein
MELTNFPRATTPNSDCAAIFFPSAITYPERGEDYHNPLLRLLSSASVSRLPWFGLFPRGLTPLRSRPKKTTMCAGCAVRKAMSGVLAAMLFASTAGATSRATDRVPGAPTSRWEEGQPGCSFSRDDDGKYRYGLWTADFGIVLAVDSQELEKVRRRTRPIFALQLTIRYRGKDSLDVKPGNITLEFVKHYHDKHSSLDPDSLASQQRRDADTLAQETGREILKHPDKKEEKEVLLAARQKDAAEMIEFLNARSLRAAKLDEVHPEVSGWVFFSTKSKWIDEWQKQEEFVLRVPLEGRAVEFAFALPPSEGDLILRRRPEN